MCGINGIVGLKDEIQAKRLLALMNNKISHRGPDDEGIYCTNEVALGHRRLSIIDLSQDAHQPMFSADNKNIIVYNGELYNYKTLKTQLSSYPFKTNSDTEVILAAYNKWGKDCLQYFNGMFAFAIWDEYKQELFIARDRIGVKPFYYALDSDCFIFSSEIRAILESGLVPRKLNKDALHDFIQYQTVHAPSTIIKDVFMLMPGCFGVVKNKEITIRQYWKPTENIDVASTINSYDHVCKEIKNIFLSAVQSRLVADVPFGAFLSGGIDSTAVVAAMSQLSTNQIQTFSITFDEMEFSEATYASLVAKKYKTQHQDIRLTIYDFMNELPNALNAMDHPSGDGPNTYVVSKATKNAGISMALSGIGGDELFAGYPVFKRAMLFDKFAWINYIPRPLRNSLGKVLMQLNHSTASSKFSEILSLNDISFKNTYRFSRQLLSNKEIGKLLKPSVSNNNRVQEIVNQQHLVFGHPNYLLSSVSLAEIETYLQNTLLRDTDQMSMAHALEVREPFLDYKLVEYVLSVPDKYKNPITPKKLLTDSLGDLIPSEVINRPKMGFTFPWKMWMKSELKEFCEVRITSLADRNFINTNELKSIWHRFLDNDPSISWSRIWHLIVLENWILENKMDE